MSSNLALPDKVYTVSEITKLIKLELETSFPQVWVEGEVSNFHRHQSGHLYFTLKDESCQLRMVMFRGEARKVRFEISDGLKVVCRGRVNVYEPRGEYQLVVEVAEPKGKGALQLAFEQLKERLKAEGLFDPKHKKALPLLPKTIGIITSPRGAAIVDILRTLERRFARLHILIFPVKVQGEGAAEEIVQGLDVLGTVAGIDVIIVGRGGGSIEDLWAFNEEKVARAIFRCPIPVISAVGHEVDFTIADFVADIRASTPSVAAEMVCEKELSLRERIDNLAKRAAHNQKYLVESQKHRVFSLTHHQIFQNFRIKVLNLEQRVDELETRARNVLRQEHKRITESKSLVVLFQEKLSNRLKIKLQELKAKWERSSGDLHNLSPLNILKKGYTLCWKNSGQHLIQRIEEVERASEVTVSFFKGEFSCLVKEIDRTRPVESLVLKEKK